MRLALLGCGVFVLFFAMVAQTAQLSFLVLHLPAARAGSLPEGWHVKVNRGTPEVQIIREGEQAALRLRSKNSSYGLERGVDIDPIEYPYLAWRWKVSELPRGGDFRRASTDDQAAQVLVAFQDRRILTYIWDSSAPRGMMQPASSIPLVRIFAIVCRSGADEANRWLPEVHNLAEDYQKAYGRRPPRVKGIRLQINTQHTGSSAESQFAEVAFRSHS